MTKTCNDCSYEWDDEDFPCPNCGSDNIEDAEAESYHSINPERILSL